jgi:uncharacterized protein
MDMANPTTGQTTKRDTEGIGSIWHVEITASEPKRLRTFMEKQFGWTFTEHDMGPSGIYNLFRTPDGHGGGIMAPMPGQPIASTPYINVKDIEATHQSVKRAGAMVMMPPTEVPGQGKFLIFSVHGSPPLACWQPTGPRN